MIVFLVLGGLVTYGIHWFQSWRHQPTEARRLAEAASVVGFVRTAIIDVSDGDNPPHATAFFIGPAPKPDALAVVSVPTIKLSPLEPPPYMSELEKKKYDDSDFAVAYGKRPDGCGAGVAFISNPKQWEYSLRGQHMIEVISPEQIESVRRGASVFMELAIGNCGWQ
ncbi:hypothetical protein [Nocardia panacis]|nr:hypothetical protein [Nocardia panacis]